MVKCEGFINLKAQRKQYSLQDSGLAKVENEIQ